MQPSQLPLLLLLFFLPLAVVLIFALAVVVRVAFPPKRAQKGRRSVCDLFSWFVFVVVGFCSSSLFFFCLSF